MMKHQPIRRLTGLLFVGFSWLTAAAQTQWDETGILLQTTATSLTDHAVLSDNQGGYFMVWADNASGDFDIFCQHFDPEGSPLWGNAPVVVTSEAGDQRAPSLARDQQGGLFVAWHDEVTGDILAQHYNSSGTAQEAAPGFSLCSAPGEQNQVYIVSDSQGGFIAAWTDKRNETAGDIYAQRFNALDQPLWAADGVPVCTAAGSQTAVRLEQGPLAQGAYLAWQDDRGLYAQYIDEDGNPIWTVDGFEVCANEANQYLNDITKTDYGLALCWRDERSDGGDIYAQVVSPAGSALWAVNGVAVTSADATQSAASMDVDPDGNLLVTWTDNRSLYDIYAQKIDPSGIAQWTADGLAINASAQYQYYPMALSDNLGGFWIVWNDNRTGSDVNLYYQHIDSDGGLLYDAAGRVLVETEGIQQSPKVVTDGCSGFLAVWQDGRNSANAHYAQHINNAIHIIDPQQADLWGGGQVNTITWAVAPQQHLYSNYRLELSSDGGQTYATVISQSVAANNRQYDWTPSGISTDNAMIRLKGFDSNGHLLSTFYSDPFALDSEAPEPFSLLAPQDNALTDLDPLFRWHKTSDPQGRPLHYEVWIDGSLSGNAGTDSIYVPVTPLSTGMHTWLVKAIDSAGQTRNSSETWQFNASNDHDPPAPFALKSPAQGFWSTSTTLTFQWEAAVDGDSGTNLYELYLNDTLIGQCGADTLTLTVTDLPPGRHTWKVTAYDLVGNSIDSNSRSLSIDNVAPGGLSLSQPAANGWVNQQRPTLSWTAAQDTGIGLSHYVLTLDGAEAAGHLTASTTNWTPGSDSPLAEGSHTWSVKAVDLLGNNAIVSGAFQVDIAQPTAPQPQLPSDQSLTSSATPTFTWTASTDAGSGVAHYQVMLDDEIFSGFTAETSYTPETPVADGAHTWQVMVYDSAGNSIGSATRHLTVDTTAPETFALLSPASGQSIHEFRPLFTWRQTGDALSGFDKYQFFIDGQLVADNLNQQDTTFTAISDLANGEHYWKVLAWDKAGNHVVSEYIYFTVLTRAPLITSARSVTATEDIQFSYTATATDEDGDAMEISFYNVPSWCEVSGAVISGTPTEQTQDTSFAIRVTDGHYTTEGTVALKVSNINDRPVISAIADQITDEDVPISDIAFTISDEETDPSAMVLIVTSSDTNLVAQSGLVISGNGTDRLLTLTPKSEQSGSALIQILVDDGSTQATTQFTVTVLPVNDSPVLAAIAGVSTPEDTPLLGMPISFSDLDSPEASLQISFEVDNTAILTPDSITVHRGENPTLDLMPKADASGQCTVTVKVSDGETTASQTFILTVTAVNDAPVITSSTLASATEGIVFTYTAEAEDTDGPSLSIVFSNLPAWLSVAGKSVTGTPPEGVLQGEFTVTASDGELSDTITVVITVTPVNDAPVFEHALPDPIINDMDSLEYSINLDDYIQDEDHADSSLTWTYQVLGGHPATVEISDNPHIARIKAKQFWGRMDIVFTATDPAGAAASDTLSIESIDTAVEIETISGAPQQFELCSNYPNPFNPETVIRFGLPRAGHVTLTVYNVMGQKVETLLDESMGAGYHELTWQPENLSSGVYLYAIKCGSWQKVKRMIYTR